MSNITRRADGTVRKGGASLNPAGRRGRQRLFTVSDFRQAILRTSLRKLTFHPVQGRPERITLFAFNLRTLSSGNPKMRLAARDFISLVQRAAIVEEQVPGRRYDPPASSARSRGRNGDRDHGTGQFVSGVSGNPRGRPRKTPPPLTLQHCLQIIEEANRRVEIRWQDKSEKVTMFEAQVIRLGTAAGSTRIAIRKNIGLVLSAAEQAVRRQKKEDERLRAEAERFWEIMENGTEEERQALTAEYPDIPSFDTMPDDILEKKLARALEEKDRTRSASVQATTPPAATAGPASPKDYRTVEFWEDYLQKAKASKSS